MFDPEKTKAFFGLAAPFVEKFRQDCESARFDTPEAVAHMLSPLVRFGLWNLPGMRFADGRLLDVDGNPMGRPDVSAHELLHDAIFRSEDVSMRYPLIDSGFSRGGITKFLMNLEQSSTFYPHPWLDPELLAQARACREIELDYAELVAKHDGDYRYGEGAPAPLKAWAAAAYDVIARLMKMPYLAKRLRWDRGGIEFEALTAFLAPPDVTAMWTLVYHQYPHPGRDLWVHFEHFVAMAFDELAPAPVKEEPQPGPPTGDYRDLPPTAAVYGGTNGNGHKPPSIATLAAAYGGTILHDSQGDPLRDAFERSQLAPKFQRHTSPFDNVADGPSQIVTDTIMLVNTLTQIEGITGEMALKAAVKLLKPTPSKGD